MLRIFEILIEGIFLYLLYKLIFNFIIPVYRSFKKARKQMQDMQNRMNEQMRGRQQGYYSNPRPHSYSKSQRSNGRSRSNKTAPPSEEGEYIDYEEVK